MWLLVLEASFAFSVLTGPWNSAGFYSTIQRCSTNIFAATGPHNDLFYALFDHLCVDLGEVGAEFAGDQHVSDVWSRCGQVNSRLGKGLMFKPSRWMSFWGRCEEFLPLWHNILMGVVVLGLERGG